MELDEGALVYFCSMRVLRGILKWEDGLEQSTSLL